jgi:hypothetical protein
MKRLLVIIKLYLLMKIVKNIQKHYNYLQKIQTQIINTNY